MKEITDRIKQDLIHGPSHRKHNFVFIDHFKNLTAMQKIHGHRLNREPDLWIFSNHQLRFS